VSTFKPGDVVMASDTLDRSAFSSAVIHDGNDREGYIFAVEGLGPAMIYVQSKWPARLLTKVTE